MENHNILLTNDDGIESPGLKAAVEAVLNIGVVTVVAPSSQQSGTGRSLTGKMHSRLTLVDYRVNGAKIQAYHCDCSPALTVRHSLQTIFKGKKPDLLISGINYGENLGSDITSSGTIGAALEASSFGIPSIAISKQTDIESHHTYTNQDWSASAFFLSRLSRSFLLKKSQPGVDVLKIDVPNDATPLTQWKITKLAKSGYYVKDSDGKTIIKIDRENLDAETDIHALAIDKIVSITPLSLNLTSRIHFSDLQHLLDN